MNRLFNNGSLFDFGAMELEIQLFWHEIWIPTNISDLEPDSEAYNSSGETVMSFIQSLGPPPRFSRPPWDL